ncbi:MAG TPA: diaminopimelate epimerase [Candidatus Dorea stercoravium]|nr:diaminopimelate epimerase [Candidatus Dorea stercoravium]
MRFAKMQGTGNDYIYVNCLEEVVNEPDILARRLSDRHFGVGADGLVLIRPSGRADFAMEIYNADGSRGEMCGNGIRCLGKYVYDRGLTDKRELDIQTGSGTRHLRLFPGEGDGAGGEIRMVEVNMGKPVLEADQVPAISEHTCMVHEPVRVGGVEYPMTAVSMGNPHAVIFTGHVRGIDLQRLGPSIEYHGRFPRRVNVEFAQVEDRGTARVRVWERGSGETLSCGTGACAVLVAGVLNDLTDRQVTVKLIGGDLLAEWREETGEILLTGPAVHVFDGEV